MSIKNDIQLLSKYEKIVFDNLDSFTDKFCRTPVFDLYELSFSTVRVHFTYILDGDYVGKHVADSITLDQFDEWYMEINK